ncbi:MAG TPA: hypothetical protein VF543_16270 [Pyrinomonadaceae bacterium]|jgi:uncharacterized protein YjhX (UPF0386 family)
MGILHKLHYSFRWLFQPHFLAGEKAEQHFEELCGLNGYIVERISQDKKSFAKYASNTLNSIKRGDFIVRNLKNAEVEVKCFSQRRYGSTKCYVIKYRHLKRHEEMQRLTGEPIIFAFFERKGRNVVENSLRMIPLRELIPPSRRNRAAFYDERIKCLCIPVDAMYSEFEYFEKYKSRISGTKSSNTPMYSYIQQRI